MPLGFSLGISEFLIKIWDAAAGQLQYLRRPKPRIEQLKGANDELEAIAADINSSINQAEREGKIPSEQIQLWVSKVTEMKGKVEATEKDFDRMRCLCGWSWNSFSVNRRVAKRMGEINKLKTGVNDIPIAKEPPPPAVVQIPTSNSTLGMEAYMREILDYIACADAGGVIGVYGMGGVGKTTLLRSINNHRDVDVFDYVIWVVASKECKMERLQMHIAKRLNLHLEEDDSDEDRATKLFSFLKNKDCLLLLDDLWEPLDLAMLGMVNTSSGQGEQKRKIVVFTTRHEHVCGHMKASRKIEIKCLGPEQAWDLFRMNAGEDAIGSDVGIGGIAHLIAQECAGLPLALITVGKAMSTKKSWQAWKAALTLMKNSQMPKVTGMKVDPMFSAFKLSYDSLEDDDMRSRLLSCAMWPEDYQIRKDELIQCWMGLDLINEEDPIHEAYYWGHSYIETLRDACLLEPVDDEEQMVQMHDVIRDMALWMSSDCGMRKFKWIVRAGVTTSEALEEEGWHEAERVSLMRNHNITSLPNQLSTCSKLLVLMLQHTRELKEIRGSLIQAMCALTYLDLEGTGIEEIPTKIGMLSHLRYLNLSHTLIRKLPAELGCLVKLKYLLLKSTHLLSQVPKGAISNLSSLGLLDLRGSAYENWLDELEGLEGCQKYISIDISTIATLQRLCSLPYVSIWRLNMKLTYSANLNRLLDDIIRCRKIRQSMEELTIEHTHMNELLIGEGKEEAGGLECLKFLRLFNLQWLKEIIWKGVLPQIVFPNLRELHIFSCRRLRNVNWSMQIPALSVLRIIHCEDMEELISDEDNSTSSSFGLTKLVLCVMGNLKRISQRPLCFPCLEEIVVSSCPFLVRLPFDNQISKKKLKAIRCRQEWWDRVKWEDASIKDTLAPLVNTNVIPVLNYYCF